HGFVLGCIGLLVALTVLKALGVVKARRRRTGGGRRHGGASGPDGRLRPLPAGTAGPRARALPIVLPIPLEGAARRAQAVPAVPEALAGAAVARRDPGAPLALSLYIDFGAVQAYLGAGPASPETGRRTADPDPHDLVLALFRSRRWLRYRAADSGAR